MIFKTLKSYHIWSTINCAKNVLEFKTVLKNRISQIKLIILPLLSHPHLPSLTLAVDLLKKMLVLDCDGRISASEALCHSYFSQYHDPEDEPEAPPYDQTPESKDRTLEEWKGERKSFTDLFGLKVVNVH